MLSVTKWSNDSFPSRQTFAVFIFLLFTIQFISRQRWKWAWQHFFTWFLLFHWGEVQPVQHWCSSQQVCWLIKVASAPFGQVQTSPQHREYYCLHRPVWFFSEDSHFMKPTAEMQFVHVQLWKNRDVSVNLFSTVFEHTAIRVFGLALFQILPAAVSANANTADACQSFTQKKIYICQAADTWQKVTEWRTADEQKTASSQQRHSTGANLNL